MERMGEEKTERLVRLKELKTIVGYSSTSIWRRIKDSDFPCSVRLGPGSAVAWRLTEVEEWMRTRTKTKQQK